jgi:CheY-like chemotaxis protein
MKRPKILLIDDDRDLLHMYDLKFRVDDTCDFTTAETPGKGIELAEQTHPDLILLDLVLPKGDKSFGRLNQDTGFHVLDLLKTNPATKNIPVVIFTNLDERTKGNVERAEALGAIDYWVKAHYQPKQIIEKVKKIVQPIE